MATEAGELVVKISADVADIKTSLQQMAGQVNTLGVGTIAAGNLMASAFQKMGAEAVAFVKESLSAFAEHEQAVTRLTFLVGTEATQAFVNYAEELQRTTAFSDDAVLALEKQLSQYGIYPGSVREATKALVDFASITGVDLPAAGTMMAKAMAGQSRELKNYGIDVSVAGTRSDNLAKVTAALEKQFHNAAETMKGTTIGAVDSLKNSFGDLQKQLGELLAPTLKKIVVSMDETVTGLNALIRSNKGYSDTIGDQKQKLADLIALGKGQISNGVALTKQQQDEIKTLVQHIRTLEQLKTAKNQDVGATDREIASIRALKDEILKLQQEQAHLGEITKLNSDKRILTAQMELAQMQADEKIITQTTMLETQKRLETSKLAWETQASYSDQLQVAMVEDLNNSKQAWVDMTKSMVDSFATSTAKMIVEGGRFSDVIKNLWKNIAEQVIAQIIRMIAEWLIWMAITGGSGGGLAFAGGKMASGGMINEPSMLIGMRTGSRHLVGEAGPEEVVPRGTSGRGNQANAGGGAGGGSGGGAGGGITINISGQFVEGSPTKWQRMIQEQIVPQLRRFSMKQPVGVVTRKRGAMS